MKKIMRYTIFFTETMMGNQLCPKSQKNFFESGGFAMGRLGYLKHEYYFAPPYDLEDILSALRKYTSRPL